MERRSNRSVTSQSFFSHFICGTRGFFYRVGSIVYLLFALVVLNDIPIYTRSTSTVARSKCFKSFFQSSALLLTVFGIVFTSTTAPYIKYIPNDNSLSELEDQVTVFIFNELDDLSKSLDAIKRNNTQRDDHIENIEKLLDTIQRENTQRDNLIKNSFRTYFESEKTKLQENFTTLNVSINLQNGTISTIQNLISKLEQNITELIEKFNKTAVLLIKKEIDKFSADQIARFDFALESAGGHIIESSETHELLNIKIKFMGITLPIFVSRRLPSVVIQPEVLPGDCWCFKGAQGYIVIKLANPSVVVDAVTVQHLPKELSPNGTIASAIKTFTVKGMTAQDDKEIDLGSFEYRDNGTSIQTFDVNNQGAQNFSIVRFDVESNHGNPDYTCIYRLRVHGTI